VGRDERERIVNALREAAARGVSKSEFARRIGTNYRRVRKWETGDASPELDSLKAFCVEFGVTPEELLGVRAEQDPPWSSWHGFLATPEGQSITDHERRALVSMWWPADPTLSQYLLLLATLRSGSR
jgi:transcriptional regulator with XRE-family HTH domain